MNHAENLERIAKLVYDPNDSVSVELIAAAARIAEMEGALSGMYTLACDDAIKVPDRLYHHVTAAAAALTPPTKEAP